MKFTYLLRYAVMPTRYYHKALTIKNLSMKFTGMLRVQFHILPICSHYIKMCYHLQILQKLMQFKCL